MSARVAAEAPAFGTEPVDRAAEERSDPRLLERLIADPATRAVTVRGDEAVLDTRTAAVLWRRPTHLAVPEHWAFLGRAADGTARLAAVHAPSPDRDGAALAGPDGRWASLRAVGGALGAPDASLFATAVSLGRWLTDAPFCPGCGAETVVADAGWSRRCPACGREHFPRTDPAVIMTVATAEERPRLLLGSNRLWGANRYSCFAGFVEAGESAESAVARELHEEAGIRVREVRYVASQPWPYPRSLMLGFHVLVDADAPARADGMEIAAVRWLTPEQVRQAIAREGWADAGEPRDPVLPGTASIARHLIARWLEDVG